MALPIIRRIRTAQPQGVIPVDRNHPVLAGVNSSIILSGDVGGFTYNNGRLIRSPSVNGTLASGVTDIGAALKFDGSSTYLDFGVLNIADEFTVLWGGTFNSLSGVAGVVDCSNGSSNGWSLFSSGTDMFLSGNHYSGDLLASGWVAGTFYHGAARNKAGVGMAMFRNGVKVASSGSSLSAVSNPTNNFWVGQLRVSSPKFISAQVSYFYLFDRYLSDDLILSLQNNPWQIFEPKVLRVEAAGGSSPQTITSVVAIPSSSVSTPSLTAGAVALSLSAGPTPSSSVQTPTLSPAGVNLTPSAAVASSSVSTPALTGANTLNVSAATPSSNAGVPTLIAGQATLTPAAAVASSSAQVPTLQNGSSIAPSAAVASSSAGVPVLTAGQATVTPAAAIASSSVSSGSLSAGAVALAPSVAIATSAGTVPDLTSGSAMQPSAAVSSSSAQTPTLIAGAAQLALSAAIASSSVQTPTFSRSDYLSPAVAMCGTVAVTPSLSNSGAAYSVERHFVVGAEQRLFTVNAENRTYVIPS